MQLIESTLPVHTPTPAPPVIRHTPANRSALPVAPAIKTSSPSSPTPYTISSAADAADHSTGAIALETRPQRPGARFVDSHDPTVTESDPQERKGAQNAAVVTFQTRPRALTGDSTNSAVYPTYATYRQSQHGNFDAFAQRIRRALESAHAENQLQQQRQEQKEQEELERQQEQTHSIPDNNIISSQDESSEKKLLSALSAAHSRQLMDATETGSITSVTGSLGSLSAAKTTGGGGRPRSSSAASIISNLSEKIRLGGTTLFSRTGRSRAGSDASVSIPTATGIVSGVTNASTTSATAAATPAIPSSEPSKAPSATTTMAAMASAAAVASAMTIPRASLYNPDMDSTAYSIPHGQAQPQARRTSRLLAVTHPLAKATHVDDDDDDNNSEHNEAPGRSESGNASRTEILADGQERPSP
ncbi:hypothetical protein BGZ68_007158 [Mortierella alpina]|nr:hypothetical protein BGZ68_007158 [Mortierella alpina]